MTKHPMPNIRPSRVFAYNIADCKVYLIAGEYPDGTLGEISVRMAKQGSTLCGLMDAFAIVVSLALQAGVPFEEIYKHLHGVRFEPSGWSNDPDVPDPESIVDYIARKLWLVYGDVKP